AHRAPRSCWVSRPRAKARRPPDPRPQASREPVAQPAVAILGAGRMGQGLGLALHRAGWAVWLLTRRPHPVVPPLHLHAGPRAEATRAVSLVILAVPDDAISGLASELAA